MTSSIEILICIFTFTFWNRYKSIEKIHGSISNHNIMFMDHHQFNLLNRTFYLPIQKLITITRSIYKHLSITQSICLWGTQKDLFYGGDGLLFLARANQTMQQAPLQNRGV